MGEEDSAFFDTERAICMEQWEQIDDEEAGCIRCKQTRRSLVGGHCY